MVPSTKSYFFLLSYRTETTTNEVLLSKGNSISLMQRTSTHARHVFTSRLVSRNAQMVAHLTESTVPDIQQQVYSLSVRGNVEEALSILYTRVNAAHRTVSHQTYATLFHACARHGLQKQGQALHQYMLANNPVMATDLFVTNHLINMYCKFGQLGYAHSLFDEMPCKNVVSWTALISGYAQSGHFRESFHLFSRLAKQHRPNEFAFASVLSACEACYSECGRQLHALALKVSWDANAYVANSLIAMYSKCSYREYDYERGNDEAWIVFDHMKHRNLISWNSMISGFQLRGLGDHAIDLFNHMHRHGIKFDRATLLSVISCLCEIINVADVHMLGKCCSQFHCLSVKTGHMPEIGVTTALMKSYSNFKGYISESYKLFLETTCDHDIVSWTAIMVALAEQDPEKALVLYRQLHRENFKPDWYTFSIALKVCAAFVTEKHASAIHSQLIKAGVDGDTAIANALIHAYARCGSIALSKQVFDGLITADLISWNSMLKSFAVHGQAKDALQLFSIMNIRPDSGTFVALLLSCSHAGLVDEGIKIFDSMLEKYGVNPQLDHYACMVDIFGRAGRVIDAMDFINSMPIKPDSVVWSALLNSCHKYGETHLAELAGLKLKGLEPKNSLGYVQISNIYCSRGNFAEAWLIRDEMRGSKVRKKPGLSWIEIGNVVHEFASGGQNHPLRDTICVRLESFIRKLMEKGYLPETRLSFFDVEEEQKAEQLFYHSEKMAFVYATMCEESLHGNIIKIMKNIRICVDCHNFMKLASDLVQKEIIIRDSNRFHHFKEGICSCNDYW